MALPLLIRGGGRSTGGGLGESIAATLQSITIYYMLTDTRDSWRESATKAGQKAEGDTRRYGDGSLGFSATWNISGVVAEEKLRILAMCVSGSLRDM